MFDQMDVSLAGANDKCPVRTDRANACGWDGRTASRSAYNAELERLSPRVWPKPVLSGGRAVVATSLGASLGMSRKRLKDFRTH